MRIQLSVLAAFAAAMTTFSASPSAQTKLSLVHPFPDFLVYTKSCKAMVAKINAAGVGVEVKGGLSLIHI